MEIAIFLLIIISTCVNVALFRRLHDSVEDPSTKLYNLKKQIQELRRHISAEHKLTRKESQELKTRATQVRKDLNNIEKMLRLKS